jgi:hypothetical protein
MSKKTTTKTAKRPECAMNPALQADCAAMSDVDLIDDLHMRMKEHRTMLVFVGALSMMGEIGEDDAVGTHAASLFAGLAIIADHADDELEAIHAAATELHERLRLSSASTEKPRQRKAVK